MSLEEKEPLTFRYLNSLDWIVNEEVDDLSFETETPSYLLSMCVMVGKGTFFKKEVEKIPYLIVTLKESNICAYKTSENVVNLWNNLVKWFSEERKKLLLSVENL